MSGTPSSHTLEGVRRSLRDLKASYSILLQSRVIARDEARYRQIPVIVNVEQEEF